MLQGSFKFEEDGMDVCPRGVAADAVRNLMSAFHGLMFRDFPEALELRVDLRQTLPYRRVKTFLSTLEDTAQTLKLQMISRKYRCTFTRNYRALMPINRRLYRVDVLEAGQGCHGALWVNGERYVLGAEVVAENQHFRSCWYNLLDRLRDVQTNLDRSDNKKSSCSTCSILTTNLTNSNLNQSNLNDATEDTSMCQYCEVDWLTQLGSILIQFDKAWTNFERTYITELISIERRARHLVMECILTDEELQLYEDFHLRVSKLDLQSSRKNSSQKSKCSKSSPAFLENANHIRQLYIKFVNVTAALNAAANVKRKGRSDYKFDLFYSALMVVDEVRQRDKSCEEGGSSWICKLEDDWIPNLTDKELQSLLPIAQPLVTELSNFRVHLKVLGEAPERIDPHLAQNQTLVAHLAELEAKWDTAVQWLSSQETAQSLAKFLSFVTEIAEIDNALINRSNKRRRKSDAISTFKTSASKPDSIDSQRQDSPFESFEDRIAALDVAAFLALPRLVVLFFFCNPKADSKNYHLMSLLLPDIIRANKKNTKMMRNSASPNNRSSFLTHRELLNGAQFFRQLQNLDARDVPEMFRKIVNAGSRIAAFCQMAQQRKSNKEKSEKIEDLEGRTFHHILERFTSNGSLCPNSHTPTDGSNESSNENWIIGTRLPPLRGLSYRVDTFCNAVEEVSITLQRAHPEDWNGFLQVVIQCLQSLRSNGTSIGTTVEETRVERSPRSERLFEGSPITCRRRTTEN